MARYDTRYKTLPFHIFSMFKCQWYSYYYYYFQNICMFWSSKPNVSETRETQYNITWRNCLRTHSKSPHQTKHDSASFFGMRAPKWLWWYYNLECCYNLEVLYKLCVCLHIICYTNHTLSNYNNKHALSGAKKFQK